MKSKTKTNNNNNNTKVNSSKIKLPKNPSSKTKPKPKTTTPRKTKALAPSPLGNLPNQQKVIAESGLMFKNKLELSGSIQIRIIIGMAVLVFLAKLIL